MRSAPLLFRLPFVLLSAVAAGPAWGQQARIAPSKSRPMTQGQEAALAAVREYARNYIRDLPDYMCIQTTRREIEPDALHPFTSADEIRELVTFFGHRETYEVQSVNGRPVHLDRATLGGNVSFGEFGTMIERIFDPVSGAELGYQRRTTLRGSAVDVFTYRVSKAHGYTLRAGPPIREYISDWSGLIYADRATGAVLRIRMECTGIPPGFPVRHLNITVDYGPATIGTRDYFLPSHFELDQASDRGTMKNRGDYRSYRKFDTDASFTPAAP